MSRATSEFVWTAVAVLGLLVGLRALSVWVLLAVVGSVLVLALVRILGRFATRRAERYLDRVASLGGPRA